MTILIHPGNVRISLVLMHMIDTSLQTHRLTLRQTHTQTNIETQAHTNKQTHTESHTQNKHTHPHKHKHKHSNKHRQNHSYTHRYRFKQTDRNTTETPILTVRQTHIYCRWLRRCGTFVWSLRNDGRIRETGHRRVDAWFVIYVQKLLNVFSTNFYIEALFYQK